VCGFCEIQSGKVRSSKPNRAGVAIAGGTYLGQPLVIGMKFTASGAANDNFCIGVTASGSISSGRMMAVSFAPFSGRCFIEHENKQLTMQTQALPSAVEVLEGCVWVQVTEKGGIRFLRQFQGRQLEDTGLLPPDMFPNWVQSYFAEIDLWLSDLQHEVDVSVEHSDCEFPKALPISDRHGAEIETIWQVVEAENWQ